MQTFIVCKACGQSKPHHALGYCGNCYHKFMVRKTGVFDKNAVGEKISVKLKEQWAREDRIASKLSKERLEDLYCTQKMSMGDIAKLYNCSRVYIMMLLRKHDLPMRTKSAARAEAKKKGKNVGFSPINEDFFKDQTPEMAYVLGFIYSDGNIGNLLDHFSISQKEPEILYKIKALMSSEHPVVRRRNQELYTLTIGNQIMIKDLLALGLTPNKSLDVKFPILDDGSYSHFIRGYFDGDGCISFYNKTWRVIFVSGSKAYLEGLSNALSIHAGTSLRGIYSHPVREAHQLSYFSKTDLVRIFRFFYDEISLSKGVFLARKYELFLKYIKQKGLESTV